MFFSSRSLLCLMLALVLSAMAQTKQPSGTATITGLVKVGETPAAGVPIALIANPIGQANRGGGRAIPGAPEQDQSQNLIQTVTDENGIYRFKGLTAGAYRVMPMTETLAAAAGNAQGFGGAGNPQGFGVAGKAVNVSDGQTVTQVDFAMARGGVITGRVTDNNGRPIIAERINLMTVDESGQARPAFGGNRAGVETDDRGVYRA